jgi:hypothetical protein
MSAAMQRTTGCSSKPFFTGIERESLGVSFLSKNAAVLGAHLPEKDIGNDLHDRPAAQILSRHQPA